MRQKQRSGQLSESRVSRVIVETAKPSYAAVAIAWKKGVTSGSQFSVNFNQRACLL